MIIEYDFGKRERPGEKRFAKSGGEKPVGEKSPGETSPAAAKNAGSGLRSFRANSSGGNPSGSKSTGPQEVTNLSRRSGVTQLHLEVAHARIAKLETALRRARDACDQKGVSTGHKILVDASEYDGLLRCRELVVAALER